VRDPVFNGIGSRGTKFSARGEYGHSVHRTRCRFRGPEHRAGERLRKIDEEAEMSGIYILSGLVAAAILVYLFVALLWPEKF
jgi:K+-transporting ATPase KdpF subunit